MRFETKFDRWLVIVLVLTACLTSGLPVSLFRTPGPHPTPRILVACLVVLVWLVVLSRTLPQYYEMRSDGLFIRQGWKKSLIPYASLVEVQSTSDSRNAPVFSTDRILVALQNGKRFLIAVAEDERFFSELAQHCPQLERRTFGLGMPLSQP